MGEQIRNISLCLILVFFLSAVGSYFQGYENAAVGFFSVALIFAIMLYLLRKRMITVKTEEHFGEILKKYGFRNDEVSRLWNTRPEGRLSEYLVRKTCEDLTGQPMK